jgi:catechol 2,3-dioxygenase-like lactoylglutathione lyase family enzyme
MSGSGPRFEAVEHVGVTVSDIERSVAFYRALLGIGPFYRAIEERPYLGGIVGYPGCRLAIADFRLPGTATFLELLQYLDPEGERVSMETNNPGIGHLCFVVGDLAVEYDRIRVLGGAFRSEGPVDRADGGRAAYFRDPDGFSVELQERTS